MQVDGTDPLELPIRKLGESHTQYGKYSNITAAFGGKKYADVFVARIGLLMALRQSKTIKLDARPKFCKPRPVYYAIRQCLEEVLLQ